MAANSEKCRNPWKNCKHTDIILEIMYKGKALPICRSCWNKIAKSNKQW